MLPPHHFAQRMFQLLKSWSRRLPYLRSIVSVRDTLRQEVTELQAERDQWQANQWVPPGHYYSPIPSLDDVQRREAVIFGAVPREVPGVDLNEAGQLELLEALQVFYRDLPFKPEKTTTHRYHYENGAFEYADGIVLYCMLRHLKPRRVVEVGSGFSSCVILDTNELYFGNSISCTFIEPNPEIFLAQVKADDVPRVTLVRQPLQEVAQSHFESLSANDVLFIDSTHVSKIDSDVNRIVFEILPALAHGVVVHFHDVFYPFEYPKEWIVEGRAWNEAYLLRAFFQYNNAFRIQYFNSFLGHFHADRLAKEMPLCLKNTGGSLWVRKE